MLRIRSILFPTDFSEDRNVAFKTATLFAEVFKAKILALFVRTPETDEPSSPSVLPTTRIKAELSVVESQDVPTGIVVFAENHAIDVIVMVTRGREGMDRLLHHSMCETVVRSAPCPVLVVHASCDRTDSPIERILVPIDFSEQSGLAIAIASELSRSFDAGIDLLHVVPDDALPYVYGVEPVSAGAAELIERSRSSLVALASQTDLDETQLRVHAFIGNPIRDIATFARSHCDGLTVVASHGLGTVRRFMLGSITEKVVRRSPCPVLALRDSAKRLLPPEYMIPKITHIPSIP